MKVNSFKELIVWQKAIKLVNEIYSATKQMPKTEMYGLVSQMQRAAVAIPSNIAEGYRRNHQREFIQFLGIAMGSAAELETQVVISKEQYSNIDYSRAEALLEEVQKMLYSMIFKLKN
ncbi:MAG: hypothetical protein A3J07_02105 [Candidatus Doudnabacteria bacterium RIFCSPLOWO2_02_FULL_49_13]|nr:MAG: hypothetical protein A3J07_02105 [Candidatus Doudnabacteria bacterium RIFCSPLOWO2_02_FULL_49_13]